MNEVSDQKLDFCNKILTKKVTLKIIYTIPRNILPCLSETILIFATKIIETMHFYRNLARTEKPRSHWLLLNSIPNRFKEKDVHLPFFSNTWWSLGPRILSLSTQCISPTALSFYIHRRSSATPWWSPTANSKLKKWDIWSACLQ
jgi:hypothetical protein